MSELLIEDRASVRILTMNRPDKRNALNQALTQALLDALHATEADDGVRSIVLTGRPSARVPTSANSRTLPPTSRTSSSAAPSSR